MMLVAGDRITRSDRSTTGDRITTGDRSTTGDRPAALKMSNASYNTASDQSRRVRKKQCRKDSLVL
ncbi:hypothetical protein QUB37_06365 [Microcoleus sp. AT3-A2]|uniref:hypothetical protein n=1 Tax=unclassified Microcoleus TaxID=2642155 RepID=UPI002FCFE084